MTEDVDNYNQGFLEFLARASSPFHAVREMSLRLLEAGFEQLEEGSAWGLQAGQRYFLTRGFETHVVLLL